MKIGELRQLIDEYELYYGIENIDIVRRIDDDEQYPLEIVEVKRGDCHTLNLIVEWED